MSGLADVLELMHQSGPRFRTLRVEGREWRHHARLHEAFVRNRSPNSVLLTARRTPDAEVAGDDDEPGESEETWKMWIATPDRMRVEFPVGGEMVTAVFRGGTWWSWSPGLGARTNGGSDISHGVGPGEGLLDPSTILPLVELEVLSEGAALGRANYRIRARPVSDDNFGRLFALHGLGSGADEYEFLVDQERGFLLRSEARLDGKPFLVLEITDIGIDEPVTDEIFTLDIEADGELFEEVEPIRRVSLADLPDLVPFTVFVPHQPPGHPAHVAIGNLDRGGDTPLAVTLSYSIPKPGHEFGNLWIQESVEPPTLIDIPTETWRAVGEYSIGEDTDMGYLRVKVRVTLGTTHVLLETTAMTADELLSLARTLVPLPRDPPQLVAQPPTA